MLWISRVKRGLPRKRLASLLGIRTTSIIYRWETGRALPSLENAFFLSAALGVPVEQLFKELREKALAKVRLKLGQADEDEAERDDAAKVAAPIRIGAIEEVFTPANRHETSESYRGRTVSGRNHHD